MLQPEPGVVDLAEARRIVGAGAGLVPAGADGAAVMRLLADVGAALGASAGATRVVTDAGWMSYDRQIGTTGVSVNPELYIAFGISGAAQHVGGLGAPEHVVSVNTDPSCPMTAMSDLGNRGRRSGGAQRAGQSARRDRARGRRPAYGNGPA